MADTTILIVEDESIVAMDLQSRLTALGYAVAGVAASGADALAKITAARPALILMDIKLKGDVDGVQVADEIRKHIDVPVIYLTAFADEATLQRAKLTEPFGYIVKPFQNRDLRVNIETALYRHTMERAVREQRDLAEYRLRQVEALREIDRAIGSSLDPGITLQVLLRQITTHLGVDAVRVLWLNHHTLTLEHAAGHGFKSDVLQRTCLPLGEGLANEVVLEQRTIKVRNWELEIEQHSALRRLVPLFQAEGFVSYYAIPLIAYTKVRGILELFHRTPLDPDQKWLEFLELLANEAAVAVGNAILWNTLQRSNLEYHLAYDATLVAWSQAIDWREKAPEHHADALANSTMKLASALGIGGDTLGNIRYGALLHDVGHLRIPESILLKSIPLNEDEKALLRRHPEFAFEMLSPIAYLKPALDIPYCHHEKWDGTGYPRGLKGEGIPLAARLFAVADVWDALRSDRPYRSAWSEEKAREYIREQAGNHFDPKVVEVFLRLLERGLDITGGGGETPSGSGVDTRRKEKPK